MTAVFAVSTSSRHDPSHGSNRLGTRLEAERSISEVLDQDTIDSASLERRQVVHSLVENSVQSG